MTDDIEFEISAEDLKKYDSFVLEYKRQPELEIKLEEGSTFESGNYYYYKEETA